MARHTCHPNAMTSSWSCSCCVYWSAVLTFIDVVSWGLVLGFIEQHDHSHCTVQTRATQWLKAKTLQTVCRTSDCEQYFYEYINCALASSFPPSLVKWVLLFLQLLFFIIFIILIVTLTAFENPNPSSYHHYFCPNCSSKETQPPAPHTSLGMDTGPVTANQTPYNNSALFLQ